MHNDNYNAAALTQNPEDTERPLRAPDAITILKTMPGLSASKRIIASPNGEAPAVEDFNAGRDFRAFHVPVSDIRSLSVMLKVAEARDCFVIRGALREGLDLDRPQRRLKINFHTPQDGRRWMLVDFDKIPLPPGMRLKVDLAEAREYLVGLLPPEFHAASYHWQLSSSAGLGDSSIVSMHIWFWLDRPVTDVALKRWAVDWNERVGRKLIDPALFNDVQAHYTAAPVFDGLEDPFPMRSGLVRKAVDEVALVLPPTQTKTPARGGRTGTLHLQPSGGFEGFLGQIGDHPGGQGFHLPIIQAIASYVATHGRDGTDIEALCEVVRARVLAADRSGHGDAYVERMASREHIIPAIEQAIPKFGGPSARRKSRQVAGVQPYFASKPVDGAKASAELRKVVGGFFGVSR